MIHINRNCADNFSRERMLNCENLTLRTTQRWPVLPLHQFLFAFSGFPKEAKKINIIFFCENIFLVRHLPRKNHRWYRGEGRTKNPRGNTNWWYKMLLNMKIVRICVF